MEKFDDQTIERIFGAEDAENEEDKRFKEYFFFNRTYSNISIDMPIRILVGHKGIGKSALLRRAYLENEENSELAVWVKPNDLTAHISGNEQLEFNQLIEHWKDGLLSAVALKAFNRLGPTGQNGNQQVRFKQLRSGASSLIQIIAEYANKKISVSDAVTKNIVTNFLNTRKIFIYIDDIDRGWNASEGSIKNISALLNALRDLSGADRNLKFRIGLRTDVYYLVRTSDESTDKIERNVVWLSWTNHEILAVIAKRIETFFGSTIDQEGIIKLNQTDMSRNILSKVITPTFEGQGHWSKRPIHNVLLSLTRKRPRDLVKLLHGAARNAFVHDNTRISTQNLEAAFEPYSSERLQDTINEFRSELPQIEQLLIGMRPTKRQRRTSENYLYTTDQLILKMKEVIGHSNLFYTNRKQVSPKSLIQFLHKIDFITARKDLDDRIERKYFDQNRFLANEFTDFGYDWEVHPAYRWALQPQDVHDIWAQIKV